MKVSNQAVVDAASGLAVAPPPLLALSGVLVGVTVAELAAAAALPGVLVGITVAELIAAAAAAAAAAEAAGLASGTPVIGRPD